MIKTIDVYKFKLFNHKDSYELELSNVISWELMNIKMTKVELKELADFINNYLDNLTAP